MPFFLFFSSCTFVESPADQGYGSLMLTFSTAGMAVKNIVPPLDMDIAYYNVYGDGPDPATFSQTGVKGPTIIENSLVAGAWTFTVDAFNAGSYLIGTGSTDVSISAGQTTQTEVWVTPLEGSGDLDISISWPPGTVPPPDVSGTLTAAGETPVTIPFTVGANPASYLYTSLDVGYYSLNIQLSVWGIVKWGLFEAVRILKDQTTEVIFDLTAEEINTR